MILQVLVGLAGVLVIARTVLSAVRTFVVPRGDNDKLSRILFIGVRRLFNLAARPSRPYAQRDRIMAYYGPIALMLLPAFWLILLVVGFGAIYWALGMPPTDALEVSGSSLLTLGFFRPTVDYGDIVSFVEAALGLGIIALMISYLPTFYSAFNRREALVGMLEARAAFGMLDHHQELHRCFSVFSGLNCPFIYTSIGISADRQSLTRTLARTLNQKIVAIQVRLRVRIRWASLSPTYKTPRESTSTPCGRESAQRRGSGSGPSPR